MLALNGGIPIRSYTPRKYPWFSGLDIEAIFELIENSNLSGFLATPTEEHLGGRYVRELEIQWSNVFRQTESVAFNSWTSGLEAAVASCNLPKGSEVITTPWTMSATVAAIVTNGLKPYFVDISSKDFNIDSSKIQEAINKKTAAILAVDIFGKPCQANVIRQICEENDLFFIVDAAQTPKATIQDRRSTEFSHVGGYSLNRHKHLQVGEGGVAVTNDSAIARRLRLFRNHAEVTSITYEDAVPVGHNLRMGEIEALLAINQLSNLDSLVEERREYGKFLIRALRRFEWLTFEAEEYYNEHDFYILPMKIKSEFTRLSRDKIAKALQAEGLFELVVRYGNLHKLPAFRNFPRKALTNAEHLADKAFMGIYLCGYKYDKDELDQIVKMFERIDENIEEFLVV